MIDRRGLIGVALASGVASGAIAQTPPPAKGGALPAGLPQPTETIDLWSFARELGSADPTWLLVATRSAT